MSALLLLVTALLAVAFGVGTYLLREPPVRGRAFLAGLRGATLALLVLLLWNPRLPLGGGEGAVPPRTVVLLDASLSMEARTEEGASRWDEAVSRAREETGDGGRILLFGSRVRAVDPAALDTMGPTDRTSRLTEALARSAELGATEVRVVSDLRIGDLREATRSAERASLSLRPRPVGSGGRNAGLGELEVPPAVRTGDTLEVEVLLHGEGGEGEEEVELTAEFEGEGPVSASVRMPEPGRPVRHRISLPVPEGGGLRRVVVEVDLSGDVFPRDDRRSAFVEVSEPRGELVLLSFVPDWEPRYLLPVLGQVTGLAAEGYLRIAGERWLPTGRLEDRSSPVGEARVRERAEGARILVVHGVDANAPEWLDDALEASLGAVLFPRDRGGTARLGLTTAGPVAGEWYPVPEVPASPLAGELSGVLDDDLPPLNAVLPLAGGVGSVVALRVRRPGGGAAEAGLVLVEEGRRRAAVALASGFWRWASREGSPRDAYRRLWAGVSGWLLEAGEDPAGPRAEPWPRVQPDGVPVAWMWRGSESDSLAIEVRSEEEGEVALDTLVRPGDAATVRTRPLAPGVYAYRAETGGVVEEGRFEISVHSSDLLRPRADLERWGGEGEEERGSLSEVGGGAPLRTSSVPYLLLLALLCAEWIGRRRAGLR